MSSKGSDRSARPRLGEDTGGSADRDAEKQAAETPPLHALLVGIDHYPDCDLYPDLEGCATDVAAMERYLVDVLDVPPEHVEKLVAPGAKGKGSGAGSGGKTGDSPVSEPTYQGLTAALRRLETRCRAGAHALFHFSGHGGRTPTAFPHLKGLAAKDECLAPVDVADPATRYLRDVEIDAWIRRMVEKGVFVTLVMDCCHAGGIRRTGDPRVRGGRGLDSMARPRDSLLVTTEEMTQVLVGERGQDLESSGRPRAAWNGGTSRIGRGNDRPTYRHAEMAARTRVATQGYALFAACRARERAHELTFEGGRPRGALTFFLLQALQRLGEDATYRQLHAAVVTGVHSRFRNQTPVFDGESRAFPLGHRELPRLPGLEVLGVLDVGPNGTVGVVDPVAERSRSVELHLGAGRAQGVGEGAKLRIHPLSEVKSGTPGRNPGVTAEVLEAGAATCRAVVRESAAQRVRPGDRAILVDPGIDVPRCRVGLVKPPSREAAQVVAEIERRSGKSGSGWIATAADDRAELRVLFGPEGEITVCGETRAPLPHLPSLRSDDPRAAEHLWRVLEHLARYESLRTRQSTDLSSPLFGMIELGLEIPPREEDRSSNDPVVCETVAYPPEIPTGCPLVVTVENRSYLPLHLVLLDLQPDWGISQIVPETLGSVRMDAESRLEIPLRSHLPPGIDAGTDVLVVLAAEEPLDCRWMELPALSEVIAGGSSGLVRRRSGALREPAWITAQTEVRVVRHA